MRVTNNMISYNFLYSLNNSMQRQNDIQKQLSDGKAIHRPSDNPVKTIRSLRFHENLGMNEQFTQNLSDATSWMESTDSAMTDLGSIMTRAKELVVGADGTKPQDALKAIGAELDGLINQAIALGNTMIGDRYIFSGQQDKTQPFTRKQINNMDVVVYNGDTNKISMPIQAGAANPSQDSVNLTGAEIFGPLNYKLGQPPTVDALNRLIEIKEELLNGGNGSVVKQSNPNGGSGTVSGTFTGTGYQNFDVRIDTVVANQVTAASYSTDGGHTWTTPAVVTPGAGSATVTLASGMSFTINDAVGNTANDIYSFRASENAVPLGTDVIWVSQVGLDNIDSDNDAQLRVHTLLGARMAAYEMAKNMLEESNTTITADLSNNEDLDVPRAIIDFKTSQNVYNAALSVGSKIMPQSLVDFLR